MEELRRKLLETRPVKKCQVVNYLTIEEQPDRTLHILFAGQSYACIGLGNLITKEGSVSIKNKPEEYIWHHIIRGLPCWLKAMGTLGRTLAKIRKARKIYELKLRKYPTLMSLYQPEIVDWGKYPKVYLVHPEETPKELERFEAVAARWKEKVNVVRTLPLPISEEIIPEIETEMEGLPLSVRPRSSPFRLDRVEEVYWKARRENPTTYPLASKFEPRINDRLEPEVHRGLSFETVEAYLARF